MQLVTPCQAGGPSELVGTNARASCRAPDHIPRQDKWQSHTSTSEDGRRTGEAREVSAEDTEVR